MGYIEMIHCPKCGNKMDPRDKVCPSCGHDFGNRPFHGKMTPKTYAQLTKRQRSWIIFGMLAAFIFMCSFSFFSGTVLHWAMHSIGW